MAYIPFSSFHVSPLEDIDIYFWSLDESIEMLENLLSDPNLLGIPPYCQFKSDKRKKEWLAVRVLLHKVCPHLLVQIAYEKSGRPYLVPKIAECSISHTKGIVSVALSDNEVGIDIEHVGERAYKLRNYFLKAGEFEFSTISYPNLMAVIMWSAKESVYKLIDLPGTELKKDIYLTYKGGDEKNMEFCAHANHVTKEILVRCYLMGDFVLTVATYV